MFATIRALEEFPNRVEDIFRTLPEELHRWVPETWDGIPSELFSPLGQICHVRDIEIEGYHVRFQRILNEVNPELVSLDSYLLAKEHRYDEARPEEVLAAFRAAREKTVSLIWDLTDGQLQRTATFAEYGAVTAKSLVHYLCSHDLQHLAGLQWLLGKIESCVITVRE